MSPNLRRKRDLQGNQTAETADGNLSPRTPRVDRPARLDDASAHSATVRPARLICC